MQVFEKSIDALGPRPDRTPNGVTDPYHARRDVALQRLFIDAHFEILAQPEHGGQALVTDLRERAT
ncbi:hypothetical protein Misp04_31290 [Micromonospora sp. NBRC 101691]|nr:hypothetical protein Misp04_31290 [Micromonospora sp. NBRC 101691]